MIDTILNINSSLNREDIVKSLPFILNEIRNYTNRFFLTNKFLKVTEVGTNYIKVEDGNYKFQKGESIEILNSLNNTLVYQVKLNQTSNAIYIEQQLISEINCKSMYVIKLDFRSVNPQTIINMVDYSEKFKNLNGIKSQTLGSYSVTYENSGENVDTMYPHYLYGSLNQIRKLNTDYDEYRRFGYVRL